MKSTDDLRVFKLKSKDSVMIVYARSESHARALAANKDPDGGWGRVATASCTLRRKTGVLVLRMKIDGD